MSLEAARTQESGRTGKTPGAAGRIAELWYALILFVVRSLGILLFDLRIFGIRHVPRKGSVMLASTH